MGIITILTILVHFICFADAGSLVANPAAAQGFKPSTMKAAVTSSALPTPVVNFGPQPVAQTPSPIRYANATGTMPTYGMGAGVVPRAPGAPFAMVAPPMGGGSSQPPMDISRLFQMLGGPGFGNSNPYASPYASRTPYHPEYKYVDNSTDEDTPSRKPEEKTATDSQSKTASEPSAPASAPEASAGTIPATDTIDQKAIAAGSAQAAAPAGAKPTSPDEMPVPPPGVEAPAKPDFKVQLEAARVHKEQIEKVNGPAQAEFKKEIADKLASAKTQKDSENPGAPKDENVKFPQCSKNQSTHDLELVKKMFARIFNVPNIMAGSLRQNEEMGGGNPIFSVKATAPNAKGKQSAYVEIIHPRMPYNAPSEFCQNGKGIKITMDISKNPFVKFTGEKIVADLIQTRPGFFTSKTEGGEENTYTAIPLQRTTASAAPAAAAR